MILADTSIWVDHLRSGDIELIRLLDQGQIATHPFIIGELACGNLKQRTQILSYLKQIPCTNVASDSEALTLIEKRKLMGKGVGFIDVHLLASVLLTPGSQLWTRDKRLRKLASQLDCQSHLD